MDQVNEAAGLLDKAIDTNPTDPAVWALRGRQRAKAGELPESLADYQRALGYRADDRETLLEVAEIYRRLNQPQRALATLPALLGRHLSAGRRNASGALPHRAGVPCVGAILRSGRLSQSGA